MREEPGTKLNERDSLMTAKTESIAQTTGQNENQNESLKALLVRTAVVLNVAVTWACATQFIKSVLNLDPRRFFAPYSLVWFNTCFMSICYPVFLIYTTTVEGVSVSEANKHALLLFSKSNRITTLKVLKRVFPFLVLWILANYAFGQSLGRISASAASSIMSTNTAMVCFLSALLINEKLTVDRCSAVVFAIAGVTVIALDNEFAGDWIGIALVIFSAASAALYKVLFKKFNGHGTLGQVSMFMSFLGLMNMFLNIIPSTMLVLLDVDHIEWDAVPWTALAGSALLGLIYNFLVNFGIALLNPLIISIGMLCGIPINVSIDILFRKMPVTAKFIVGAILIIVSFVLSTIPLREIFKKQWEKQRPTVKA